METQRFWCVFFMLTWIFVFFLLSVCSGMDALKLSLDTTVYVALAGEDITIKYKLEGPADLSGNLTCRNPSHKQIYSCEINKTDGELQLKHLTMSGEYSCQYQTATVYWFLRVRNYGYESPIMLDCMILSIFTAALLVFSVVGSVYVFRGQWKEEITECRETSRKRKQNKDEGKAEEMEEDNVDVIHTSSTSFYASLEPRPRSIYDVLDRSAANGEQDKAKAKKKEPPKTKEKTTQHQDEGIFESVYENF